ncbi:hypothetical protein [Actinomycetospora chlora]|uniref:hypothetical protein n=1 Tax=Actinomycetospora chlora TaxID=663608 RepID=UPI0031E4F32C
MPADTAALGQGQVRRITDAGFRIPGLDAGTGPRLSAIGAALHVAQPSQTTHHAATPSPVTGPGRTDHDAPRYAADTRGAGSVRGSEFRDAALRTGLAWASVAGVAGAPGSVIRDPDAVRRAAGDLWGRTATQAAAERDRAVGRVSALIPSWRYSGGAAEHGAWSARTEGSFRIGPFTGTTGASSWAGYQVGAHVGAEVGKGGLRASVGGQAIGGAGAEAHGEATAGPVHLGGRVLVVVGAGAEGHASVEIGGHGGEFSVGGRAGAMIGVEADGSISAGDFGEAHVGVAALAGFAVVFNVDIVITGNKVGFSVTAGGSVVVGGTVTVGASFNPSAVGNAILTKVTDVLGGALAKVGGFLGDAYNKVADAAGAVRDTVGHAVDTVRDAIGGAVDAIGGFVKGLGGAISSAAESTGAAIADIAGKAGEAVGWLWDKIFGSEKPAEGGGQQGPGGGTAGDGGQGQGSGSGGDAGSGSGSGSDDSDDDSDGSDDGGGGDDDPEKDGSGGEEASESGDDGGDGDGSGGPGGPIIELAGGDAFDRALRILLTAENTPGSHGPGGEQGDGDGTGASGDRLSGVRWDPSRGGSGGGDQGDGDGTGRAPIDILVRPGGNGSNNEDLGDGVGNGKQPMPGFQQGWRDTARLGADLRLDLSTAALHREIPELR